MNVPAELLEEAQEQTGAGATQAVTAGLQKLALSNAYKGVLAYKGSGDGRCALHPLSSENEG